MKTLFLLRHAAAENAATGLSDHDRALNGRGRQEAQTVGTFLKKQNLTFDFVLCSTARRARDTADLVLSAAELTVSVRYDRRIYEASPLLILEVISEIGAEASAVLLVGHNPGMAELLQLLTGRVERMPTCTLAKIDLNRDAWAEALGSQASLDWIVKPEDSKQKPDGQGVTS